MKILVEKSVQRVLAVIVIAGAVLLVLISVILWRFSEQVQEAMLQHDYQLATKLQDAGMDASTIQNAFSERESGSVAEGKQLLNQAGYGTKENQKLQQEIAGLRRNMIVVAVLLALIPVLVILFNLIWYFIKRARVLRRATEDVARFLEGDISVRLEQYDEGSLSLFFNAVNGMAKSLNVHIERERKGREFLRDTIADISHQLKTPLAAMQMYNEILREEKSDNPVIIEFLEKTDREIQRMSGLIMNLLKLAKLDSDTVVLERREGSITLFMQGLVEAFRIRAEQEQKKLELEIEQEISLFYDEEWLYEALSNLVKNALDHTSAGDEIIVRVRESFVLKEIIITDTGSGIHPEDIHHIFKKFYRSRYSKDRQGTGIGLTMAATIIEKHGGTISVVSEQGHGTTFTVAFPKLTNM